MEWIARIILVGVAIIVLGLFAYCSSQYRAKHLGGTHTETLQPGQKLVTATWKESNMWILTRPMQDNEQAITYTFKESSMFGLAQGTVIIHEKKSEFPAVIPVTIKNQ